MKFGSNQKYHLKLKVVHSSYLYARISLFFVWLDLLCNNHNKGTWKICLICHFNFWSGVVHWFVLFICFRYACVIHFKCYPCRNLYQAPWKRTYCKFISSTWMTLFIKVILCNMKEVIVIAWHLKDLLALVFICCLYVDECVVRIWIMSNQLCYNFKNENALMTNLRFTNVNVYIWVHPWV